jgi:flagellar hook-length control protein FliK
MATPSSGSGRQRRLALLVLCCTATRLMLFNATAAQAQNPIANPAQPQTDAGTSQGQPQPQPQAPAEAAKPADAPAPAASPTNATPVVAPAPTAPVLPINAPTGLQRLVPLYKAPETTATMIHIAAERGVTHARLNLKPVELGGIEVRLRTTPEGVAAQLVADSPEAAKLLQSAAADLRRDLEARDVNLLSLDVSTQQDQQQGNQQAAFTDEFGDARSFGLGGRRSGSSTDESLTEIPASAETTLVLPNGVLVDVLA